MCIVSRSIRKRTNTLGFVPKFLSQTQASDLAKFKQDLKSAKEVVVLSGAGISAESGIPTFRGKDGLWRKLNGPVLASPSSFKDDPGLVWEFYHYRRELVLKAKPNAGHIAVAQYEARHTNDKKVTVVTQNVDGLHAKAGTNRIIELHGNLFKTRCTKCNEVLANTDSPICPVYKSLFLTENLWALAGRGSPSSSQLVSDIQEKDLPHCKKPDCGGLLRPHVVWFGETLEFAVVEQTDAVISRCNVCLVVGTSSLVFPAAAYPSVMAAGGTIVAEFNIVPIITSHKFDYYFEGPSSVILPQALSE